MNNKIFKSKKQYFLLIGFLLMFNIGSGGSISQNHIKVEVNFNSKSKDILLTILNVGNESVDLFNPDLLKEKRNFVLPAYFQVKLRDREKKIITSFPNQDDFITALSLYGDANLLPILSTKILPQETIKFNFNFNSLITGYREFIPRLYEVTEVKFRYFLYLDGYHKTKIVLISDWLALNE